VTRSVTLADLMPSRVAPTAKPAAVSESAEDALGARSAPCFAQALEDAGSADVSTEKENGQDERDHDAGRGTDPVATTATATGKDAPTPVPAGVSVASLARTETPRNLPTCPPLPSAPPHHSLGTPHDHAAASNDASPHKPATPPDSLPPDALASHLAASGATAQSPSPSQSPVPQLNQAAVGTMAPLSDTPPARSAPPTAGAVSPAAGTLSSAATETLRAHAGAWVGAGFTEATNGRTASPRPPEDESADAPQAPPAPDTTVTRPVAASPPPQAVASANLPASPHGDAGKQLRDSNAGADNGAGQVPGHAANAAAAAAAGSQPVVLESMSTPVVTTNSGEFAVRLDHATAQPPRSDFVVSNNVLTATLSKPLSEGNGTYSVTAMLNPPSLGHMQAVVKVDGTNVNVVIVAHTPEGHRAIAAHLDELRSDLAARGGDVQLSLSDGGAKGDRRDRSEPPPAAAQDSEETDTLVLTVAPAHGAKSLHVIL